MILKGPFQLKLFYDSMISPVLYWSLISISHLMMVSVVLQTIFYIRPHSTDPARTRCTTPGLLPALGRDWGVPWWQGKEWRESDSDAWAGRSAASSRRGRQAFRLIAWIFSWSPGNLYWAPCSTVLTGLVLMFTWKQVSVSLLLSTCSEYL